MLVLATLEIGIIFGSVVWSYWKIKNLQKTIPGGYVEKVEEWMRNKEEFLDKK